MRAYLPKPQLGLITGLISGGLIVTLLLAKATPTQQPVAKVLRAQRFELVGPEGKLRATLSLDADNEPFLRIFDKGGREEVSLGIEHVSYWGIGDNEPVFKRGGPVLALRSKDNSSITLQVGEYEEKNTRMDIAGPSRYPKLSISDKEIMALSKDGMWHQLTSDGH